MLLRMSEKTKEFTAEDFVAAVSAVVRRVRADAPPELRDFSWTQKSVLSCLANGPATSADLARAEGVKPQSMGATITALEETGLVRRKPHPTDGRQVNIELTPKGAALRTFRRNAKRTWLTEAISQLNEHDRETLFAASDIIRRLVESDRS